MWTDVCGNSVVIWETSPVIAPPATNITKASPTSASRYEITTASGRLRGSRSSRKRAMGDMMKASSQARKTIRMIWLKPAMNANAICSSSTAK